MLGVGQRPQDTLSFLAHVLTSSLAIFISSVVNPYMRLPSYVSPVPLWEPWGGGAVGKAPENVCQLLLSLSVPNRFQTGASVAGVTQTQPCSLSLAQGWVVGGARPRTCSTQTSVGGTMPPNLSC